MSRQIEPIARAVQLLLRRGKGRAPTPLLLLGCVLLAGYLFAEPYLESRWGVDLPGVHGPAASTQGAADRGPTGGTSNKPSDDGAGEQDASKRSPTAGETPSATAVEDLIRSDRQTYTSPAGLRYTRGTQHGHHLRHLMAHAVDEPDRPGPHGVFDAAGVGEIVAVVDEAYELAVAGARTDTRREGDKTVHIVNMRRRIGYVGGQTGGRRRHPAARHVQLVLVGDKLITAYPIVP